MVVATKRIQEGRIEESSIVVPTKSESALRVLIDARKLGHGGIGSYIENLLVGLSEQEGLNVSALVDQRAKALLSLPNNLSIIQDNSPLYSLDELFLMPRRIDFTKYDIFHVPHYTLPFFVGIPTVITVHDLIHITHPERWYYPYISRILVRSALNRASQVITVSQTSKDEVEKLLGKNSTILGKVNVVPNIVSPHFLSSRGDKVNSPNGITRRNGKYLLAVVSNLKPHKGLNDLIQAFELAQENLRQQGKASDVKLIIAGQAFRNIDATDHLLKHIESLRGIHLAGEVTTEELRDLYTRALAVVVPSTVEGFCMPVIEAHACGIPVIARPVAAIREISTQFDCLASDMSVTAFSNSIAQFLENFSKQDNHSISSHLRNELNRFEINKVSRSVVDVYRRALNKNPV